MKAASQPVLKMRKLGMGGLMIAALSLTLSSPVTGDNRPASDAQGVYPCLSDDIGIAGAAQSMCTGISLGDDGCQQQGCEVVLGAVVIPDPVALPHTVRTFEPARTLEGGAATTLHLREGLESGWVRLVPDWPRCVPCDGDDIELDPDEERFLPFDIPYLWRLIREYPVRRL